MKRYLMITLFLIVFTSLLTAIHYYVFWRLLGWFGIGINAHIIIIITALILLFPAASLLAVKWTNRLTNTIYDVAAIWLGSITILLIAVVAGEIVELVSGPRPAAISTIIISLIAILYALYNASKIHVMRYTIEGAVKEPHTIAVASDIHAGPVHGKKYLARVTELIRAEKPEMLLLPGDLVDGPGVLPDDILTPLASLSIPIYYSFGNHEHYVGEEHVNRIIKKTGIRLLRDEAVTHNGFTVAAVDDREDKEALKKHFPKIPKDRYTILLYHRPDGLRTASEEGVDLVLSGHTHNGQIFPFNLVVRMRFPNIKGWYQHGKTKHYVSTGAGTWGPPMRLGSRSEVVIMNIIPEGSERSPKKL